MKTTSVVSARVGGVLTLCVAAVLASGCASHRARKHLEDVAKGWCETIRASQVIPVYPLTEDLVPGDVFLVQTTIESQVRLYRQRGFLSLDDHRVRLKDIDFKKLYFDGYWKDEFGATPHPAVTRTNAGAGLPGGTNASGRTFAPAPRAAFPTYAFAAKSGWGLALAVPIKGVPVGLNFLRTDRVNGSVTIADARTYAADEQELSHRLREWADDPEIRQMLSDTVRNSGEQPVFLRVVSRVYLAGAMIVSLNRADALGASAEAGKAPKVELLNPDGNVNENYTKLMEALNRQSSPLAALTDAGGAVKYLGASESSVSLAESFDRLLVIGYLGFDVPVYRGGDLGAPIPTFQRLTGGIRTPPMRVDVLSLEQQQFKVNEAALEGLAAKDWRKAMKVIDSALRQLPAREFELARDAYEAVEKAPEGQREEKFKILLGRFKQAAVNYVSREGSRGARYARFDEVFARAYDERDRP